MVETFLIKCSRFLSFPVSQRCTLKLITCQNFLEIEKVRSSDFNPTNPIEVRLVGQNPNYAFRPQQHPKFNGINR